MGYKYSYDIVGAFQQIRSAVSECRDIRTDSYIAWGIKQDLYQMKWFLDDMIKNCPEFGPTEAEWLKEQEQEKILKILKNEL